MPHKSFASKKKHDEDEVVDPISFDLGDEADLGCRTNVNGSRLLRIMAQVESGKTTDQINGLLSVFELVLLREDGSDPELYSGKPFDPEKPNKNHSAKELRDLAEEGITPGIDPTSSLGRLNQVLDDPDTEIKVQELTEIVSWLLECYTGDGARPTKSSGGSSSGTRNTKASSGRKRQPRALTGVPSDSDSAST